MSLYPKIMVLVEISPNEPGIDWRRQVVDSLYQTTPLGMADVRAADVTNVLAYNRSTPGDPWDKPYPAMYADLVERLS